ncbi:hypothetical protein F4810DRAFT_663233 [Camillea tinctor]|nr:hypothetical protein F4810DRAFT_663233 [Camillea tinctor]
MYFPLAFIYMTCNLIPTLIIPQSSRCTATYVPRYITLICPVFYVTWVYIYFCMPYNVEY